MPGIEKILTAKAEKINQTLTQIMNINNMVSNTLFKAMKYSLFSGGKRIRPILTILVAEMVKGNLKVARKVGAVIELIHTYSLIHDDLPSMDNDDYRRGKLSNHKVYGPGIAILAGDGLLTYAFNILSRLDLPSKKLIKIIEVISNGAGVNGMVGGQVLDLEAERKKLNLEELKKIHSNKTGALFKSSILAGAYCGQVLESEIEALIDYARYLGLTFQITDDILDVTGDKEKLGKETGSDEVGNKTTYISLLGLEQARVEAQKMAVEARKSLDIFGERAAVLKQIPDYILERQY